VSVTGGVAQPAPRRARVREGGERVSRALARHPTLSAALLLALVVLGYLWPVLVGGKALSPGGMLFHISPWRALEPADLADYYNRVLVDVPIADLPWRAFVRELLHAGTVPAWNPHTFAGTPLLANPQTGLFSLFSLPLWLLPFDYAVGVEAAVKLWAAAFGMYLLARQLRLGFLPGVAAGVVFAFSALNIVWLTHATVPAVAALLPWIVWLLERLITRARSGDALALALATAIALGGGHPGMQVHVLLGAGLYLVLRLALRQDGDVPRRRRPALLASGGIALGVLAMSAMLLPEVLSTHGTIGVGARANGGVLPGSQMPFDAIKTVAFPDWWGRPSAFELPSEAVRHTSAGALVNYNERTFYAGAVALLLALIGFVSARPRRAVAPFAVLALLGLAVALHAPGLYWLATHVPPLSQVQSQRLHFLFAFGVAIGAAFGLQAVIERPRGARWRLLVPLGGLVVALLAVLAAGAPIGELADGVRYMFDPQRVTTAGATALASIGWFVLFTVGVGLVLAGAARRPSWGAAAAALLALLLVADAYHFASGYQPMARAAAVNPPSTPAIAFLRRHADEGRFVGVGLTLIPELGMRYGVNDVRGYSPPQPTERYYRLWRHVKRDQTPWQPFELDVVTPPAVRVVSVLGARWIVTDPDAVLRPTAAGALDPLRVAYSGSDAAIYENPNAVPRAFVASATLVTANEAATRDALTAARFDPRRTAVVERDELAGQSVPSAGGTGGSVRIVDEQNARVTLRATLPRRALVVLADNFSAGWSVTVDGRAARALHVDDVVRGVVVDAGRHEIRWSYAVPGLRLGVALSIVALLIAGGCAAGVATAARSRGCRARYRRSARDSRG
jgi:hypothetical protein